MAAVAANTLADRFAWLFDGLCKAIGIDASMHRMEAALAWAVWNRVRLLGARFAALAARGPAASPRRATPRASSPAGDGPVPAAKTPPTVTAFPREFGWVRRALPETAQFAAVLSFLLRDPELAALVRKAPEAGRILRPLCHLLGVKPPEFLRRRAPGATEPEEAKASPVPSPEDFDPPPLSSAATAENEMADPPQPPAAPPATPLPPQRPPSWAEQEALEMRERVARWVIGRVDPPSTLLPLGMPAGSEFPGTRPDWFDAKNRG